MAARLNPFRLFFELLAALTAGSLAAVAILGWTQIDLRSPSSLLIGVMLTLLCSGPLMLWRCLAAGMRSAAGRQQVPLRSLRSALTWTFSTLLIGWATSAAVAVHQFQDGQQLDAQRFDRQVELLVSDVRQLFNETELSLVSIAARRNTGNEADWLGDRLQRLQAQGGLRAVQGFGHAVRGADGHSFTVRSFVPAGLVPHEKDLDFDSHPVRREALTRALRTREAALSSSTELAMPIGSDTGFLYLLPLAAGSGADGQGIVYARITIHQLTAALQNTSGHLLDFQLLDGDARPSPPNPSARFSTSRQFQLGHHALQLQVQSSPGFETDSRRTMALALGLGGAVLSAILALVVWLLAFGRNRAQALAQARTVELDRLARVARYTSNAVVITNAARRIVWVNQGFERITGYSTEEALGRSPGELLQFDKTDRRVIAELSAAMSRRESFRGELLNRSKHGREYWLELEVQPLFDSAGELTGFMAIETDVSERKAMQAEVERSQTILLEAIDAVDEGFVLFDPQDRLVLCNDQYRRLYPLCADIIQVGTTFEAIVRTGAMRGQFPEAVAREDAWVAERLAAHRSASKTLTQVLRDGRTLRVIERRMPDGHTVGFRIDITDLIDATEAAREAARVKGQFLANMSHEIRTPMNAIIGMTGLALESELNGDQRELIGIVRDSAASLLSLINDLLDFSKIEAGQMRLERIEFDLRECVGAAVRTLAGRAREKALALDWAVAADVPTRVMGDPHRVRQVLLNLLSNALKFTDQGGVYVKVSRAGEAFGAGQHMPLQFLVRDTGLGIAADRLDAVFAPFEQADTSTTRRFGGTGLGLTICRDLVRQMGGKIWVDSVEGQGSNFHFTARLDEALQPAHTSNAMPQPSLGMPVLWLPGPARADAVLTDSFSAWRVQARPARDWAEAEALLQQSGTGQPLHAVLLMASALPAGDPLPLAKLMAHAACPKLVIVLMDTPSNTLPGNVVRLTWPAPPNTLFDALTQAQGFSNSAVSELGAMEQQGLPEQPGSHRILLAEDNLINQKLAVRLLQQLGHTVTLCNNGSEAVDANAKQDFDLIFMDLQMPVMGGIDATALVRALDRERGRYTPIVAMTAHARPEDRDHCLAVGMDGYVSKPISKDALVHAIQSHARRGQGSGPGAAPAPGGSHLPSLPGGLVDLELPLGRQAASIIG